MPATRRRHRPPPFDRPPQFADIGDVARRGSETDGYFELEYKDGFAWLTVYPPEDQGRPVYYEDVRNRMRLLDCPKVSYESLMAVIDEAAGEPRKLVEWPDGARLASSIRAEIADDLMSAAVFVTHPKKGAAPPRIEDITRELERVGVTFGIDSGRIRRVLEGEDYDRWITVAEGREPVHARSAEITYHFDPNRGRPYVELEFGRIDLRELKFIENRDQGDLLAELTPPVEPQDGRTVTGAVVAAETDTSTVELRGGAGTEVNEDATAVYAAESGNVRLRDGLIVVEPVVTVENVSYETGHIRHEGSVVVQKHVADGFVVEATGDIEIGAGVGKATLRAGGNILLKTGINGNGEGSIECDGNVFARYVESSTVQCGGHLLVQEGILHSRVSTWGHCVLNGRRSEIIGSNMIVGGSVWCKQIGSVAEGPVYVSVGIPPSLLVSFRDTKRALDEAQSELEGVQLQLRQIENAIEQRGTGDKLLQARAQLEDTATDLAAKIKSLRHDMHELREKLTVTRGAMLVAEESMYKGVVVAFGTREFRVPDGGARATILVRHGADIEEHGYNAAEPPVLEFEE